MLGVVVEVAPMVIDFLNEVIVCWNVLVNLVLFVMVRDTSVGMILVLVVIGVVMCRLCAVLRLVWLLMFLLSAVIM